MAVLRKLRPFVAGGQLNEQESIYCLVKAEIMRFKIKFLALFWHANDMLCLCLPAAIHPFGAGYDTPYTI